MTADFHRTLVDYLVGQRWFADKGGTTSIDHITRLPWLQHTQRQPYVRVELVAVVTDGRQLVYHVPVSYYTDERPALEHAFMGVVEDEERGRLMAYDALHDRAAIGTVVSGFVDGEQHGGLIHRTTGPLELQTDTPSVMITGEQSNTSLVLGDDLMLKIFRKIEAGRNPDIEVHEALASTGSQEVARLRGWIETDPGAASGHFDLAMLQDFLRSGTDGWQYARASVRDLMAEGDLHADEVGGDFAGEAERLGGTVAELHRNLAAALPTAHWGAPELAALSARLQRRLREAVDAVPELDQHAAVLAEAYDDLASLDRLPVQRVHGDLHLGQSLRTVDGWRIIDFEGEPAKPLAERTGLDAPARDVAGMLRSFDYAAHSVRLPDEQANQQAHRAAEWAERNREAFCAGYAGRGGAEALRDARLLRAYEVDKALYEAVYEKRNRPSWLAIPLAAVRQLAEQVVS